MTPQQIALVGRVARAAARSHRADPDDAAQAALLAALEAEAAGRAPADPARYLSALAWGAACDEAARYSGPCAPCGGARSRRLAHARALAAPEAELAAAPADDRAPDSAAAGAQLAGLLSERCARLLEREPPPVARAILSSLADGDRGLAEAARAAGVAPRRAQEAASRFAVRARRDPVLRALAAEGF